MLDRKIEAPTDEITPQVIKAAGQGPQGLPHGLLSDRAGAVGRHVILVGQIEVLEAVIENSRP